MSKVRPLFNRILVELIPDEEKKSPGGILIPITVQNQNTRLVKVLAAGPGKRLPDGSIAPLPEGIKPGATLLIDKYVGNELRLNGETLMVVHEDHVLGVVEE